MPRYIDRDTALSHPFANGQYDKENANEHFIFGFEGYKEWLEQLPTVDAEPVKHGRWQKERNPMMYQIVPYVYVCSQCGTAFEYETPYCGECGAKMDEVEDG